MKACLTIPIFDHGETVGGVVDALAPLGLPCLIVDDGSGLATRKHLSDIGDRHSWVHVTHHDRNRGKGAALQTAYRLAHRAGFSHVVQIDADGQHEPSDVPRFLDAAQLEPHALVLGDPVFDASVPRARLYGRKLSQVIVWIETLSLAIRDPLCGLRCVPLEPTIRILEGARLGNWMDFDPELVVRLVRAGTPIVNIPTAVHYPSGGISHFRMLEDNLRIAWAYARLTADGVRCAPGALARLARGT